MTNKVSFCILLNKLLISPERNCIEQARVFACHCFYIWIYVNSQELVVFTKHVKSEVHGGLLEPSHTRQNFTLNCSKTPITNESICKILTELYVKGHVCCVYAVHSNTNRMNLSFEICELIFLTLVISTVTDTRSLKILTVLEYN